MDKPKQKRAAGKTATKKQGRSARGSAKAAKPKTKGLLRGSRSAAKAADGAAAKRRAPKKTAAKRPKKKAPKALPRAAKRVQKKPAKPALARSPLAPASFADMAPVAGVQLATGLSGTRYKGRDDVLILSFVDGTAASGVFTKSKTASAPVEWCRQVLENGEARALVVNAGNANAFTGKAGLSGVRTMVAATAAAIGCRQRDVLVASTGVIGEPLPELEMAAAIERIAAGLHADGSWEDAASAIMTTDTFAKGAFREAEIGGIPVKIAGIAKGSGMIAPDMATMLAFVVTDAALPAAVMQTLLLLGARDSFNSITVDSDTSTSDSLVMFATGEAFAGEDGTDPPAPIRRAGDPRLRDFREALDALLMDLAMQVVRDGEGASKLVTITVSGAASYASAKAIALSVANSPLVKTAIAGEDANWGRIVMAVGKAGEPADRDALAIRIGGIEVAKNGAAVDGYDEAPVARHMKKSEIGIEIDVGVGRSSATVYTCDLGHGYIDINADYRS